jgi:hypothetical protein
MAPKRAQVKGVGASLSPGGTKTIDFKIGGAFGGDLGGGPGFDHDATQAALLGDLLAGDEDAHYSRDNDLQQQPTSSSSHSHYTPTRKKAAGGPSPGGGSSGLGAKPSALAAKYGVAFDGEDSDSDGDFGPDDSGGGGNGSGSNGGGGGGGGGVGGAAARVAAAGLSASEFGPLAAAAQENLALKAELDERRQQVGAPETSQTRRCSSQASKHGRAPRACRLKR